MVLLRFLEDAYAELTRYEQKQFEALLEEQDPDLISWLWGDGVPPQQWNSLIGKIQVASQIRR